MILRPEADHINVLNHEGVKGKLRTKSGKREAADAVAIPDEVGIKFTRFTRFRSPASRRTN